jgi:hypothetical protein
VVLVFGTLVGCGSGGSGGSGNGSTTTAGSPGGSILHPSGANEVVLQVTTGGGFVPIEFHVTLVPEFSLYGNGRVIVPGSVPAIYPGPALPNLQTTVIPEESVQAILSASREAGLFVPAFDYGQPGVADGPTTTFVVNAGGATYRSAIYSLTVEGAGGLSAEQQQARAALNDLRDRLVELTSFTKDEIVWKPYQYSTLAVFSQAADPGYSPDPTDVQPNRLAWPLGDLSTLGEEASRPGLRRVVVSGQDLAVLRPLLDQATQITLWNSGGKEYHLLFRPLLPNETATLPRDTPT